MYSNPGTFIGNAYSFSTYNRRAGNPKRRKCCSVTISKMRVSADLPPNGTDTLSDDPVGRTGVIVWSRAGDHTAQGPCSRR